MKTMSNLFKNNIREYGMLIALIVIMIFFYFMTDGILMKPILFYRTATSSSWRWACC